MGQIITAVVVTVPLVTAGISLIIGDRIEVDHEGDILV